MNLALSALIIILLLLPGIIFRASLIKSETFENPLDTSLRGELVFILLYSVLNHLLYIWLISDCAWFAKPDLSFLYRFLMYSTETISIADRNLDYDIQLFSFYIVGSSVVAAVLGVLGRKLILWTGIDKMLVWLRVTNEWDDLLAARDFRKKNKLSKEDVDVGIHAIVEIGASPTIYTGSLDRYYLAKENKLDKLYLIKGKRKPFRPEATRATPQDPYLSIPGYNLVISMENIKTLNVRYKEKPNTEKPTAKQVKESIKIIKKRRQKNYPAEDSGKNEVT